MFFFYKHDNNYVITILFLWNLRVQLYLNFFSIVKRIEFGVNYCMNFKSFHIV